MHGSCCRMRAQGQQHWTATSCSNSKHNITPAQGANETDESQQCIVENRLRNRLALTHGVCSICTLPRLGWRLGIYLWGVPCNRLVCAVPQYFGRWHMFVVAFSLLVLTSRRLRQY